MMDDKLKSGDVIKILEKIIGPVKAVGESHTDRKIKDNLQIMIDIGDWCLYNVWQSSKTAGRPEASMNEIGSIALEAIKVWNEWLQSITEEDKIIRCKDCKHNSNSPKSGNAICELFYGMTDQMGFCSYAERRINEI